MKKEVKEQASVYRGEKNSHKFLSGNVLSYKVILEPCEEGGYSVYVPSLQGCVSEGDTYEEALNNIKDAIKGWLEVSREYGDEIPPSCEDI